MIKLEVNHGKHKKTENGKKLTIPQPQQKKPVQEKVNNQKSPKADKKEDDKKKKDQGKQAKQPKGKKKKEEEKQKESPKKNDLKIGKKQEPKGNGKKDEIKGNTKQNKGKSLDRELDTIQRIKKEGQKTKLTINELINQYKDVAEDIFVNHGHNPEKQMAIDKKLEELKREKEARHAKISKIEEKVTARQERMIQRVNSKIEKKEERTKQKHKKRAEKKIAMLKALSQERLEKEAKFQQWLHSQYKKQVPQHEKIKQEYEEREKEYQENVKQILQKNKRKFAPMNIEELQDFQDDYEAHKYDILEENQRKREETREMIESQNRELFSKVWKGQCHKNVKKQLQELIEKKNEGKTKLQKTKQYGTLVKSSYKPKIDDKKRSLSIAIEKTVNSALFDDEDDHENSRYKKVAKEKYIQGVNQGLVFEKLRKSLDHEQQTKKGNQYLQHLRNLPKVRKDGVQSAGLEQVSIVDDSSKNDISVSRKNPSTTFKQKRQRNPYYGSSLSERIPSKGDDRRIKDPQVVTYLLADIKARHREMTLEQKVIKHGRYHGVLELQSHHNSLNKKMIQSINDKLSILSRM